MKACTVDATFTQDGTPRPRRLMWEGQTLTVTDIGRRWSGDEGRHLLVRVADGRVFELAYNGTDWRGIPRTPPRPTPL